MNITWFAPAAFAGLALIALPIAIHLLVRQQTRTLPYPSLRFLRETALAAFRRRRLEDALLLLCRAGILVVAVVALAGPIVQTPSRTASYSRRIARAHISVDATPAPQDLALAPGAFRFASFSRVEVADAIRDAVRWLNGQPPASREIVITGALARGSIHSADLLAVPADIGIGFVPRARQVATDGTVQVLQRRNGALMLIERRVHLESDSTSVVDGNVTAAPADALRVAASRDQALAGAALDAQLEQGVLWSAPDFEEPVPIAPDQLAAWSRSPGPPSPDAPLADEGDRRWLWALALLLLAIEHRLRGAVTPRARQQEARVA
jgi:hypothetical protein